MTKVKKQIIIHSDPTDPTETAVGGNFLKRDFTEIWMEKKKYRSKIRWDPGGLFGCCCTQTTGCFEGTWDILMAFVWPGNEVNNSVNDVYYIRNRDVNFAQKSQRQDAATNPNTMVVNGQLQTTIDFLQDRFPPENKIQDVNCMLCCCRPCTISLLTRTTRNIKKLLTAEETEFLEEEEKADSAKKEKGVAAMALFQWY